MGNSPLEACDWFVGISYYYAVWFLAIWFSPAAVEVNLRNHIFLFFEEKILGGGYRPALTGRKMLEIQDQMRVSLRKG